MELIASITIITLSIMGLFHFYWAFGGRVGLDKVIPTIDGLQLFKPGKMITIFVGIILLIFAFVAYVLQFDTGLAEYKVYAGWTLSALFFIRAIGDFKVVGFFKKIKSTEFAEYDTKYFSPLCVLLGLSFFLLSVQL